MNDEKSLELQRQDLSTFKTLTQVYTEIASIRMKRVRDSVLKNRDYLASLDDVFTDVRVSYARDVLRLGTKTKDTQGDKITFLSHNGKTVGVFLAANTGLYGDIIEKTFALFVKEIQETDIEVTVVGKIGLQYLQGKLPDKPYTYFDLSDKSLVHDQLSEIIKHLVQYEEIRVYYPAYQSAVKQVPTKYTISAQTPLSEIKQRVGEKTGYIFEPSLKEILVFFEKEIFASLLDQTIRESQLAKFAARIMALDRAGENIKKELHKLRLDQLRLSHRKANKKQSERLTSMFA